MNVAAITIANLFAASNFGTLIDEYATESKLEVMPDPDARQENYEGLEKDGRLFPFAAFDNDSLIGFVTLLVSRVPHYSQLIACTESFFVSRPARSTGAGLVLLDAAERKARDLGVGTLLISTPVGGPLEKVLQRKGYRVGTVVYHRRLLDA